MATLRQAAVALLLLCLGCLCTGIEGRGSNGLSSYRPWKATRASEIVVVGADGQLWGLDGATGAITWQFFTGMPLFSFHSGDGEQEEGAMPFFIPSADGELYTFVDRGLQRVGMTVNDLVAGAPLFADDGSLWLASKELSVWAIDQDGELLRAWSSARGMGADEDGYQLPLGMELPAETLVVVRADYAIRSIDPATGATKWNMTVGEFVGVERGLAPSLEASNLKVMLTTDGSIFGLNHEKDTYLWMNSLPVPVVAVFNLQQDSDSSEAGVGEEGEVWRLHKAAAPALPADLAVNLPVDKSNSVFIGVHDGHVYALPGACSLPQEATVENDPTGVVSIDSEDDENFHLNSGTSGNSESTAVSVMTAPQLLDEFCTPLSPDFPHCIRGHYFISPSANFIEGMGPLLALGDGSNGRSGTNGSGEPIEPPTDLWLTGVTATSVFVAVIAVGFVIVQRRSSGAAPTPTPEEGEESEGLTKQERAEDGSVVVAEERKSRLVDLSNGNIRIGNIEITKRVLGYGSGGTIVYEGALDGRRIAVKRMLASFYVMAEREVALLLQSDEHPHVVRYYTQERDEDFVYLALSYCSMNLEEFVDLAKAQELKRRAAAAKDREKKKKRWRRKPEADLDTVHVEAPPPVAGDGRDEDGLVLKPQAIFDAEITDELIAGLVRQIVAGVAHLHSLKIVHRDLKPQNVLLDPKHVVKISDMGLGKKLDKHQQSFSSKNPGTLGWQAPEILKEGARQTNKVDIFALGCLTFYMLTRGEHPFGARFERESNILTGHYELRTLADPLARHLIEAMITHDPAARLCAEEVDSHPFFWSAEKRLHFLRDASDRLEVERANASVVMAMESRGPLVIDNKETLRSASTASTAPTERGRRGIPTQALSKRTRGAPGSYSAAVLPKLAASGSGGGPKADWLRALDRKLQEELRTGKFRKYNGQEVRDLLRVIRNKAHHFRDLPGDMQAILGPLPGGFVAYFEKRFPQLLLQTYLVLKEFCFDEPTFQQYFHAV